MPRVVRTFLYTRGVEASRSFSPALWKNCAGVHVPHEITRRTLMRLFPVPFVAPLLAAEPVLSRAFKVSIPQATIDRVLGASTKPVYPIGSMRPIGVTARTGTT